MAIVNIKERIAVVKEEEQVIVFIVHNVVKHIWISSLIRPSVSPVRAWLLSKTCESELTIWEKKLLADYRQAA